MSKVEQRKKELIRRFAEMGLVDVQLLDNVITDFLLEEQYDDLVKPQKGLTDWENRLLYIYQRPKVFRRFVEKYLANPINNPA